MQRYNVAFIDYKGQLPLAARGGCEEGFDMDTAVVGGRPTEPVPPNSGGRRRLCQAEAEASVRTPIEWAGDDPDRDGLAGAPERVVRAYEEFFAGYNEDPVALPATTFKETAAYDEMIVLHDIRLGSHCEHPIVPMLGKAHIGYLPAGIRKPGVGMVTSRMLGSFRNDPATCRGFLAMIGSPRSAPHES